MIFCLLFRYTTKKETISQPVRLNFLKNRNRLIS